MRLTLLLLKRKLPRGHIFRGKNRLVREVTPLAAADLREAFAVEERNMFYLRHSYLSIEQSRGREALQEKRQELLTQKIKDSRLKFRKDVTMEQRLRHLRVTDAWD